jgi:serine protease AprX
VTPARSQSNQCESKNAKAKNMKQNQVVQNRVSVLLAALALLFLAGCCGRRAKPLGYVPREGKLETPLIARMAKAGTNEMLSIVVTMDRQLLEDEKRKLLQGITGTNRLEVMRRRRQALTQNVQQVARESQEPLLTLLRRLETKGVVSGIQPFWLANVVAARVPSNSICHLGALDAVASIHLDQPQSAISQGAGVATPEPAPRPSSDPPGAPGPKGVVVAVLDTGVNYNHTDLKKRMWRNAGEMGIDTNGNNKATNHRDDDGNGFVDDVKGWNFSGPGSNDPVDTDWHGTHVAGIVAGDGTGDGTNATQTGIAPQAQIMALRQTGNSNLATEQECWRAIEYAVDNGAHIINFSSGWIDTSNPDFATWRTAVQNVTDAGVLFVAAAGDVGRAVLGIDFKIPFNVLTPGRAPAALTVGSSETTNQVAKHSSLGPVTWEKVEPFFDYPYGPGPGLVKPDLLAPGANVNSTWFTGGYKTQGGTSMAAPRVAGAAALLLDRNPALSPYELRYLLEETAGHDSPLRRPDPTNGWGRLDHQAALAALGRTIDPSPYDLVVAPGQVLVGATSDPSMPFLVSALVTNLGGQVVGNTELRFYYADAASRSLMDLDPNGDGKPDDTNFTYIASYFVPVLGPKGSKHGSFEGVVRWTNSTPVNKWWIGVWAVPGATSDKEINPSNNGAVFQVQ